MTYDKTYSNVKNVFGLLQILNPNSINTLLEFLNKFTTGGKILPSHKTINHQ
jgi:hypothetical protein